MWMPCKKNRQVTHISSWSCWSFNMLLRNSWSFMCQCWNFSCRWWQYLNIMKRDTFNQVQSESIAQLHWVHEQKEEKRFTYLYLITLNTEILKNSSTLNIQNGMRLYDKDLSRNTLGFFWKHRTKGFSYYIWTQKHSILMKKHLIPKKKAQTFKNHTATKMVRYCQDQLAKTKDPVTAVLLDCLEASPLFSQKHLT